MNLLNSSFPKVSGEIRDFFILFYLFARAIGLFLLFSVELNSDNDLFYDYSDPSEKALEEDGDYPNIRPFMINILFYWQKNCGEWLLYTFFLIDVKVYFFVSITLTLNP